VRKRLVAIVFVLGLVAVGVAVAGLNRNTTTHLNGTFEVPARATNAQGQAIFHLSNDETQLDYKLIASNIDNVFQAHIHMTDIAAAGVTGPVVVWLYPSTTPGAGPPGGGRTDGVLAEGTITAANLVGPLALHPLRDLLAAIEGGHAYVNIHTSDGTSPADTAPGDFPGGEIRGNLP
jgi:hypothetical protein